MKTYPEHRKCPTCGTDLFGQEFTSVQVNCETSRHTLAGGHIVTHEGLCVGTQCVPEFNLPDWVNETEFQADFDRVAETIQAQVRSGRGQYRVYARYQMYSQPTETGRIRVAKQYMGICVDSTRSLYHGNSRVKVGEVTL